MVGVAGQWKGEKEPLTKEQVQTIVNEMKATFNSSVADHWVLIEARYKDKSIRPFDPAKSESNTVRFSTQGGIIADFSNLAVILLVIKI